MILTHGANSIERGGGNTVNIGGRDYHYVEIGSQVWLTENLDLAPTGVTIGLSALSLDSPTVGYYDNNEQEYGYNGKKCGMLYNWIAVNMLNNDRATLFPGWHVPSYGEYLSLFTSITEHLAAKKLKSLDSSWFTGWNGTDEYGFNLLPAGGFFGSFGGIGTKAYLWSSTNRNTNNASAVWFTSADAVSLQADRMKSQVFSLRLIKDT